MLVNSVILFLILGSSVWPGMYYVHQEAGFGRTEIHLPLATSLVLGLPHLAIIFHFGGDRSNCQIFVNQGKAIRNMSLRKENEMLRIKTCLSLYFRICLIQVCAF